MLEILKYITSDFWVFCGTFLILILLVLFFIKITDTICSEINVAFANFLEFLEDKK